jgi:TonB-linked SusC/RagA family outer membrane protein
VQFEPVKGLTLKSSIGPKVNNFKNNFYLPGVLPERMATLIGGYARINSNMGIDILNENTLTFAKQINQNHKFDLLAGFTWQTYRQESYRAEAEGFTNDVVTYNNLGLGDPTRNVVISGYNSYQLVSWLGRLNYNYKEKYLLTVVGRVDGSSRFDGAKNQYAFFPSVALAWRLIEEPWIKDLGVFKNLKLRTSYGISGSQAIGSYRTLATLDSQNMFFNGTEQPGVRNGRPASPDLRWETTKQADIGLESSYLNGRLAVEIDYYHKKTVDLLLDVEIPRQTGFSSKLQNLGSVQNQGLEILINSVNMSSGDFSWETSLSLAGNRSKVLDIGPSEYLDIVGPTNQGGPGGRLYVGESVPVFVGVEYLGVWKSQEEIDASGQQNQLVGGPHFKDTDGNGVISEQDFEILGSPEPLFYGGLMNSFSYKNIKLDIYLNGSYGNDLFNSVTQQAFFFREGSNSYKTLLDHWDPVTNPDSEVPMPGTSQSLANIKNNSKEIDDGSYLRLKSVRISYDIPEAILQKVNWIQNLSFYISGSNLALLSSNRLFDPEVSRYGSNSTQIGFTQGEYPYARTITLGLKADF